MIRKHVVLFLCVLQLSTPIPASAGRIKHILGTCALMLTLPSSAWAIGGGWEAGSDYHKMEQHPVTIPAEQRPLDTHIPLVLFLTAGFVGALSLMTNSSPSSSDPVHQQSNRIGRSSFNWPEESPPANTSSDPSFRLALTQEAFISLFQQILRTRNEAGLNQLGLTNGAHILNSSSDSPMRELFDRAGSGALVTRTDSISRYSLTVSNEEGRIVGYLNFSSTPDPDEQTNSSPIYKHWAFTFKFEH